MKRVVEFNVQSAEREGGRGDVPRGEGDTNLLRVITDSRTLIVMPASTKQDSAANPETYNTIVMEYLNTVRCGILTVRFEKQTRKFVRQEKSSDSKNGLTTKIALFEK